MENVNAVLYLNICERKCWTTFSIINMQRGENISSNLACDSQADVREGMTNSYIYIYVYHFQIMCFKICSNLYLCGLVFPTQRPVRWCSSLRSHLYKCFKMFYQTQQSQLENICLCHLPSQETGTTSISSTSTPVLGVSMVLPLSLSAKTRRSFLSMSRWLAFVSDHSDQRKWLNSQPANGLRLCVCVCTSKHHAAFNTHCRSQPDSNIHSLQYGGEIIGVHIYM